MSALAVPFCALVFALTAGREWQRNVLLSRVALGCSTLLVIVAMHFPGLTSAEVLAETGDGLTYLYAVGRMLGLACALTSAVLALRELAEQG